jgi:hypothetical protein
MTDAKITLADALAAVVAGDLRQLWQVTSATHDDLRGAAATLPSLLVDRGSVLRAVRAWRTGQCSDAELNTWAWLVRGGAIPYRSGTQSFRAIEINYEVEHEDLITDVVGRLSELGDLVDGRMDDTEVERILADLDRAGAPVSLTRAVVELVRQDGSCSAKTDNDLSVAFRITDGTALRPGEVLDIQLPGILESKLVHRVTDGKAIAVSLQRHDIRDLRLPVRHGAPSDVSEERVREK